MFKKTKFILSAADPKQFPVIKNLQGAILPEIAIVGRSNVGKSSLINHLTQIQRLARVSSTPGKTQLINFFNVDDQFLFVDLPGYGFANVPKVQREQWGRLIQNYLANRSNLKLILLLLDLRHPPSEEDISFAQWALHFKKPFLVVFTKADKLGRTQIAAQMVKNCAILSEALGELPLPPLSYSIKEGQCRQQLIKEIINRGVKR